MQLFGVVNASPDSLHEESRVDGADSALARARQLLADGANAIDVGGQGSTDIAEVVDWQVEWTRLADVIPALATLGVDVSVDTWKPEVARRALDVRGDRAQRRRRNAERSDVEGRPPSSTCLSSCRSCPGRTLVAWNGSTTTLSPR